LWGNEEITFINAPEMKKERQSAPFLSP